MSVTVTKTCAACGRVGTRGFARGCAWLLGEPNEYVCKSGPACERRCNKKGFSIYG